MNIYVGNLPYKLSEDELKAKFSEFGQVKSVSIVKDRETGSSKGFGFVEMETEEAGQKAVEALAEWESKGRKIKVSQAKPREESRPRERFSRAR
ncbi:MAG: RNA recognition motif domain-containing protein [Candidatus Sericytochromatia bacterium]